MTAMDLLPTFAKLAGAELPTDRVIDGKDIWPVLSGTAKTPHEAFFYYRNNDLKAIRSGKWKFHLALPKFPGKGKTKSVGDPALFDLDAYIGEKKNVFNAHPEVVKRLRSYVETFGKELAQNSRPAAFVGAPEPLSK